ncbi:MAG: hypothetical protein ABIK86_01120 [candidate division WOR-3 bacterium]
MRQRILTLLAVAVVVLIAYTVALRPRSGGPKFSGVAASERLAGAVAAQATRSVKSTETPRTEAEPAKPAEASGSVQSEPLAPVALGPVEWGADPFVRDWIMINELANLRLKATTLGGDGASALINDQILQEGDLIAGKRIVRIELDKVTLEQGGRTFTLTLGE